MRAKFYALLCIFILRKFPIVDCSGSITASIKGNETIPEQTTKLYQLEVDSIFDLKYEQQCPENEEFKLCESCAKSCSNFTAVCSYTEPCRKGCFCKKDLVRDKMGKCIHFEKCFGPDKNEVFVENPIVYKISCSDHQVYNSCRKCEKTCSDLNPSCDGKCKAGCFCVEGYLKAPDGKCVLLKDCPKAEITVGGDSLVDGSSIEECQPDEVFVACGWCEGTCSDPKPQCPAACTRGCLCRPPLVRHYSGHCVAEKDCLPPKCEDPNEVYECRYGCTARCQTDVCLRARRCRLGCHCRQGLYRDRAGRCVAREDCFSNWPTKK